MTRKRTAIDLFAGCGGCTVGLQKAGFAVLGAVEIDPLACDVYHENHPKVHLWRDGIETVVGSAVLKQFGLRVGELDLLAGCPPCQGFSSVRTLNGKRRVRDRRNDLIFEFQRLVDELRPRAVMLENVPGLASDRRMTEFQSALEELGYCVDCAVLDAANFGVPQRRKRVILLAGRFGSIPFGRRARVRRSVRDSIGRLPVAGKSGDPVHDLPEHRSKFVREMIALVPKNGGSRTDLPLVFWLPCHQKCDGFKDIYGRMRWDDVAPTLTTGCFNPSRGRFLHPEANRAITMREAAVLQTFPMRYKFPASIGKTRLAVLIGNALPPEFVRRHALSVRRYLDDAPAATARAPARYH